MLTEDRRRRIHSVQQVQDNAKKLKSARQYHSAGTAALEAFEDQTLRHRDDAFWLPSNVLRSTVKGPLRPDAAQDQSPQHEYPVVEEAIPEVLEKPKYTKPESIVPCRRLPDIYPPTLGRQALRRLRPQPNREVESQDYQYKLASDIAKLLDDNEPRVQDAACRFFEAFDNGLAVSVSGLHPLLMDAAVKLSDACQSLEDFEVSYRVLDVILSLGPISEDDYNRFSPDSAIQKLLRTEPGSGHADAVSIRKACHLFLVKFREKPKAMSDNMFSLGEALCQQSCGAGLYDLTQLVYTRLESCRGGRPLVAVDHLIRATHARGQHKKIFRYYARFYTKTSPEQEQYLQITGLAIDSMLALKQYDKAEEILASAARMAKIENLRMSTTWLLRLFGEEWRLNRDLTRAEALFRRLEPLLSFTSHPQALYGAMIQYCVESRDDALALDYYTKLTEFQPNANHWRIDGHFALAKAFREDWEGVKEDFRKMKQFHGSGELHSIVFAPILKEFSKKHSASDTESFIQYFLVKLHLKTTPRIMNIMVDVYAKSQEVDAVSRWISYAIADGCDIGAVTTNTILKNCVRTYHIQFERLFALFKAIRNLGPHLVDNNSINLLRSVASSGSPNPATVVERLRILKALDDPKQSTGSNGVYRAMAMTFAKENYAAVLKVYTLAERDNVQLGPKHLLIVVEASLRLHGQNLSEAVRFIKDAQRRGVDVTRAVSFVFIDQLSTQYDRRGTSDRHYVDELAQNTIAAYEKSGIAIPQEVLTHVASVFQRQGRYQESIDFWDIVSRQLKLPPSSFDLATLTTLLQGYLKLRDLDGIRWVMDMIVANRVIPDRRVLLALKNTRRETVRQIEATFSSTFLLTFLDGVEEAFQAVKAMRVDAKVDQCKAETKMMGILKNALEDQALRTSAKVGCELRGPKESRGEVRQSQVFDPGYTRNGGSSTKLDTNATDDVHMQTQRLAVTLGS